ncbi:MAG: hypothetical protein MK180_06565 [Rhodobacteraceae bacterium]|nr:hypothetical protein [Paracoccaceae bacterium]
MVRYIREAVLGSPDGLPNRTAEAYLCTVAFPLIAAGASFIWPLGAPVFVLLAVGLLLQVWTIKLGVEAQAMDCFDWSEEVPRPEGLQVVAVRVRLILFSLLGGFAALLGFGTMVGLEVQSLIEAVLTPVVPAVAIAALFSDTVLKLLLTLVTLIINPFFDAARLLISFSRDDVARMYGRGCLFMVENALYRSVAGCKSLGTFAKVDHFFTEDRLQLKLK